MWGKNSSDKKTRKHYEEKTRRGNRRAEEMRGLCEEERMFGEEKRL